MPLLQSVLSPIELREPLFGRLRAPVIGSMLAFNQNDPSSLEKIGGCVEARMQPNGNAQIEYRTDQLVRGFVFGEESILTQPFRQLLVVDTEQEPQLFIACNDVLLKHNLPSELVRPIGVLLAGAVVKNFPVAS